MDVPDPRPERLCFLGRPVAPGFQVRLIEIAPGAERPYDAYEWGGALVVVERGEIELEGVCGRRWRFTRGAILWLAGLPIRGLHNPASNTAVLAAVSKSDEFPAARRSISESDLSRRQIT
jgi:hypothetical protein